MATDLSQSVVTMPSDSEPYTSSDHDGVHGLSELPSPDRPMILYQPTTMWSFLRSAAINLVLPFVNGMMLGFGELFAHEAAFRLGWANTKVCLVCGKPEVKIRTTRRC